MPSVGAGTQGCLPTEHGRLPPTAADGRVGAARAAWWCGTQPPCGLGPYPPPLCFAAAGLGCLDLHLIWATASPPPAWSLLVSSASTGPRKTQSDGSATHGPRRPSPWEPALEVAPPDLPTPALAVAGAHVPPWPSVCQLLPASSSSETSGHWPTLVLLLVLPNSQGSQAPSLLHPPSANTNTQSAVLLCPWSSNQPTNFPAKPAPRPLSQVHGRERLPRCPTHVCPYPPAVYLEPGSSPVGPPPRRFPAGLPGTCWGTHLPCAGLGGPLYPGQWLLLRRQARLGQITNDKQTGHSQRPAPHRTRLKTPNAPKPWGHLSGRLARETKMEQEPSQRSPPPGSLPDALLGAPDTARPGLVPPLPTAIPRKDAPGRLTDQRERNQLVLGGPTPGSQYDDTWTASFH